MPPAGDLCEFSTAPTNHVFTVTCCMFAYARPRRVDALESNEW